MTPVVIPMEVDSSREKADELVFALPEVLWDLIPAAVYACDVRGIIVRFNRRAAQLWGREPKLLNLDERYCGAYKLYRLDGSELPRSDYPMADVLLKGDIVRDQEVMIERPDGSRIIALVNIEPLRDGKEAIIGAINCFQDISERKRSEAQIATLAREAEHRAKNILATVQATAHLTRADTVEDFKQALNGRIQALANAHTLFVESRWTGADLRTLAVQELSPYCQGDQGRARIEGPDIMLEPSTAQMVGVCLRDQCGQVWGTVAAARACSDRMVADIGRPLGAELDRDRRSTGRAAFAERLRHARDEADGRGAAQGRDAL